MVFDTDSGVAALAKLRPAVRLTLPPSSYIKFPPSDIPRTLSSPPDHPTLAHPFTISNALYDAALSPLVPTTIALVYITAITYLNSVNESRNHKPWAFSKTRMFKLMVITHNILLAAYSAWTFVGMINAFSASFYSPFDEFGLAGTVDSLCKVNGPRGVGSAATYNETTSAWGLTNRFFHLGADGLTPEATDVGRLWNEGLAFYGWLFYLSKFYEVIDTLIIIAKGKRSSFLQTYHHAGAMLCMWAGIRYMSAPIWMFVLVNSFIHSIMYSFYLCSALNIRVPVWFKRTLTTLQITQFVVGAIYAFAHLFIKYQIPISTPYLYQFGDVVSSITSDVSSAASHVATATMSADYAAYLKKALLRAAGREGLAENVFNNQGRTFGIDAQHPARDFAKRSETRYKDELQWVHCLDTSGQTFAVLLNVLYLAPLTWLFVRFFIRSYLQRLERRRSSTATEKAQLAIQSSRDASRGVGRRVSQALEDPQGGIDDIEGDDIAITDDDEFNEEVKTAIAKANQGVNRVKEETKHAASKASKKANKTATQVKEESKDVTSKAKEGMSRALNNLKDAADPVKAKAQDEFKADLEKVKDVYEKTKEAVSSRFERKAEDSSKGADGDEAKEERDEDFSSNAGDTVTKDTDDGSRPGSSEDDPFTDKKSETPASVSNEQQGNGAGTDADGPSQQSAPSSEAASKTDQSSPAKNDAANNDTTGQGKDKTEGDARPQTPARNTKEDNAEDDLSLKEQVRSENADEKSNAEASTGDAEEAETPSNQPTEESHKKDTSIKDSNIKDVSSKKVKVKKSKSQKAQASAPHSPKEQDRSPRPDSQDHEDQQSSWIHVRDDDEGDAANEAKPSIATKDAAGEPGQKSQEQVSGPNKAKKGHPSSPSHADKAATSKDNKAKSKQSTETQSSASKAAKPIEAPESGLTKSRSASPQWFEKLTTGLDSPSKVAKAEKREQDKIIDESEPVRDEIKDTQQDSIDKSAAKTDEAERKAQDKIIDESESVRDEVVGTTAGADGKSSTEEAGKKEQDKIIDESEPVRDDVKDTTDEVGA